MAPGPHPVSATRAFAALARANAVFWPSIRPVVHRHLRYWRAQADQIPDGRLRHFALSKLRHEQLNCEVAATLSSLVSPGYRPAVITATVALQVMYDYLDGITELPNDDCLRNSRQLFGALLAALGAEPPRSDYYRYFPAGDDGGYLHGLAVACGGALWKLPSTEAVLPVAIDVAARCGEAQSRAHAVPQLGHEQLTRWANETVPSRAALTWWEYAAASAASVLAMHVLMTAAAHPGASARDARDIDAAYLPLCALSTLLDSLVDRTADSETHRFTAYYKTQQHMTERLVAISALATASVAPLRNAGHHTMTVAGIAAYYLSAPLTSDVQPAADQLITALQPLVLPLLPLFRLWRSVTLFAQRRRPRSV